MSKIFDKQISALNSAFTTLQSKLQQEAITECYEETEKEAAVLNENHHKLTSLLQTHQNQVKNCQEMIETKIKLIDSLKHKQNYLKEKFQKVSKSCEESIENEIPKSPINNLHDNSVQLSELQKYLGNIEEMFYKLDIAKQQPLCKNCLV